MNRNKVGKLTAPCRVFFNFCKYTTTVIFLTDQPNVIATFMNSLFFSEHLNLIRVRVFLKAVLGTLGWDQDRLWKGYYYIVGQQVNTHFHARAINLCQATNQQLSERWKEIGGSREIAGHAGNLGSGLNQVVSKIILFK